MSTDATKEISLTPGSQVVIERRNTGTSRESRELLTGIVRFVGERESLTGLWYGIEVVDDHPDNLHDSDTSRYFECAEGGRAVFVRRDRLRRNNGLNASNSFHIFEEYVEARASHVKRANEATQRGAELCRQNPPLNVLTYHEAMNKEALSVTQVACILTHWLESANLELTTGRQKVFEIVHIFLPFGKSCAIVQCLPGLVRLVAPLEASAAVFKGWTEKKRRYAQGAYSDWSTLQLSFCILRQEDSSLGRWHKQIEDEEILYDVDVPRLREEVETRGLYDEMDVVLLHSSRDYLRFRSAQHNEGFSFRMPVEHTSRQYNFCNAKEFRGFFNVSNSFWYLPLYPTNHILSLYDNPSEGGAKRAGWLEGPLIPDAPRQGPGSCFWYHTWSSKSGVFVSGGYNSQRMDFLEFEWDSERQIPVFADSWRSCAKMPHPMSYHEMIPWQQRDLIVCGGKNSEFNKCQTYNVYEDQWGSIQLPRDMGEYQLGVDVHYNTLVCFSKDYMMAFDHRVKRKRWKNVGWYRNSTSGDEEVRSSLFLSGLIR